MTYVVFPDRRKSLATKNLRRLVPRIGQLLAGQSFALTQVQILNSLIFIDLRWWCRRPVLRCLRDASDEDLPPFRDKITPGGGAKVSGIVKLFFSVWGSRLGRVDNSWVNLRRLGNQLGGILEPFVLVIILS